MHDELDELLALHALGALDGDDRDRLDAHLATGCPECVRGLVELERTAAALAWSAPPAAPPDGLRRRVLASLDGADAAREPVRLVPRAARGPRAGAVAAAVALLAAAVVAIFVLTSWLVAARSQLDDAVRQLADARADDVQKSAEVERQRRMLGVVDDPAVRYVRLSTSGSAPEPGVDVAWNPGQKRGLLYARSLPKVGPDRAYELWLIADGAPVPAVVFNTDANGNAVVEIGQVAGSKAPQQFAVTVEPAGGSKSPTTKPILAGTYGA